MTALASQSSAPLPLPLGVDELGCCEVFARELGSGNPTTVVRLARWPARGELARLASFFGSMETTFAVADTARVELRWFCGAHEVPLCGHGALAAAHVLAGLLERDETEVANKPGRLWLGTGATAPEIVLAGARLQRPLAPVELAGVTPAEVLDAGRDYLVVLESEAELLAFDPARAGVERLDKLGCIVTAPSARATAAFRFFAPRAGIAEDDASASVLPALVAFWGAGTARESVFRQRSRKDVVLRAARRGDRVAVQGDVLVFARGALSRQGEVFQ